MKKETTDRLTTFTTIRLLFPALPTVMEMTDDETIRAGELAGRPAYVAAMDQFVAPQLCRAAGAAVGQRTDRRATGKEQGQDC